MPRTLLALLVAVCCATVSLSAQRALFVDGGDPACSDSRRRARGRNETAPLCTLQAAVDRVRRGDTVRVKTGSYELGGTLVVRYGGSRDRPVTIEPYGDGDVRLVGPAAGEGVRIEASHVIFQGFEITGAGHTGLRNYGSYNVLRGNRVHDNARGCGERSKCGQGIASNALDSVGVLIEANLSYRNGSGFSRDHCYYVAGRKAVVRNNVAWDCSGYGFQIYADCDDCEIYNNVSFANRNRSGFVLGGEVDNGHVSSNMRVYNNIAARNGQYGFYLYNNGSGGIELRNNIAFANGKEALGVRSGHVPTEYAERGTIETDPLFVNPAGLDWHVAPESPAVDAGTDLLYPPTDVDGDPRPAGDGVDIGVDEVAGRGD